MAVVRMHHASDLGSIQRHAHTRTYLDMLWKLSNLKSCRRSIQAIGMPPDQLPVTCVRCDWVSSQPCLWIDRIERRWSLHLIASPSLAGDRSRAGAEQRCACVRAIEVVVRRPMPKPPLNPSQWPRAVQSTDAFFRATASSGTGRSTRRRLAAGGLGGSCRGRSPPKLKIARRPLGPTTAVRASSPCRRFCLPS